jgi:hypothetical protein
MASPLKPAITRTMLRAVTGPIEEIDPAALADA